MLHTNVIIPVYNSYDDVKKCIESVLTYTKDCNIIIADDCSTEPELHEYYRQLRLAHPELEISINEKNKGYIKNINHIMSNLDGDIVLLNSDTIVTDRWLEKLTECAYSSDIVGIVCPLTNNGDLCSVPVFMRPNPIPDGYDINSFAQLVEKISFKSYPKIPTATGFCIYIKQAVIKKIGLFDDVNLVNAYGDENDYCYRAANYGFITVLADDTFVFHRGGGSYTDQREFLAKKNMEQLKRLHPNYLGDVALFIEKNPLYTIHKNIETHLKLNNGKRNLLILFHATNFPDDKLFTDPNTGGTEFHVRDLTQGLDDFNVFLLGSSGQNYPLTVYIDGQQINYKFPLQEDIHLNTFYSDESLRIISKIITGFHIDMIHVHHLLRHTFDLSRFLESNTVPTVITFHDYYLACPRINFINCKGTYCMSDHDSRDCDACIRASFGYGCNFIDGWKFNILRLLQKADALIAPSAAAKGILEQYYDDKIHIDVIEHGLDTKSLNPAQLSTDGEFRVAFIGVMVKHKGSDKIHSIITSSSSRKIQWHLFGQITDPNLESVSLPNVMKHGYYERSKISQLLIDHKINLVCILSVSPETFSYTLSETIEAGIPVLATDIGALGERVRKLNAGWLVDVKSNDKQILDVIEKIRSMPQEYNAAVQHVRSITVKSVAQMLREYHSLYTRLIKQKPAAYAEKPDMGFVYTIFNRNAYMVPDGNTDHVDLQTLFAVQQENANLKSELTLIKGSTGWRLLDRIKKNRLLLRLARFGLRVLRRLRSAR